MKKFSCPLIQFTGVIYDKIRNHERWFFLFFLIISLLQLWMTKFIPSLDGPQHLYNANVMVELLKGNELMRSFFDINEVIVGYWTGHFFLAFFKLFFPAWLAEKLFLTTYVIALVYSFRYLVKSINFQKGNFVSFLIFPFAYHSYLLLGYYSFSIAAIFFFLALAYWIRNHENLTLKRILIFGLLSLGVFLSHGLVFVFFCLTFTVLFIALAIYDSRTRSEEVSLARVIDKAWKSALAILPSLVLWIIYIRSVMSINSRVVEASYSFSELLKFLARIRQLVGFDHQMEAIGYIPLFALILLLIIVFIVVFSGSIQTGSKKLSALFSFENSWIFVALLFLGLYLFAPDRISAGSLTNRFGLFFFFAVITWLSMQKMPKTFQVISLVVILFSVSYSRYVHNYFYKPLNREIQQVRELAPYIEDNAVITGKRPTRNWLHFHFQLYAAVDDPFVHLQNPQCQGQFPVVWNVDELPRCFAGDREESLVGLIRNENVDYPERSIDYITIFDNDLYWKDSANVEMQRILKEYYQEVYVSSKGTTALWENKNRLSTDELTTDH